MRGDSGSVVLAYTQSSACIAYSSKGRMGATAVLSGLRW